MKVRRKGLATVGAAFALAALVAVIGAAQAAPSTKLYDATVRVVSGPVSPAPATATLRLTLTNSTKSKQTLGSANFTAGNGITLGTPTATSRPLQWTASKQGANVVAFRSTVALKPGELVSADVAVTTSASCIATWTTHVKQSNDFSGTGNDFTQDTSTNLRPLGSLAIADIGTEVEDPDTTATVFVPQIKVSVQEDLAVTAKDICGAPYTNYGRSSTFGASATLARKAATPPRLVNATLTQPAWTSGTGTDAGTGTAALTPAPADVETGDHLVLSDQFTSIKAESNEFDVVETICTSFDDTCHWNNGNDTIRVDAPAPPLGASLGVGFSSDLSGFSCNNETDKPVGETLIYVNPRDYPQGETQSVTFTYDNTIPGTSGNLENFQVCMSKGNGVAGSWFPVLDCEPAPPASEETPCVEDRGRLQGDIFVTVFLDPTVDPAGGMT
jgi:hypothetical protein